MDVASGLAGKVSTKSQIFLLTGNCSAPFFDDSFGNFWQQMQLPRENKVDHIVDKPRSATHWRFLLFVLFAVLLLPALGKRLAGFVFPVARKAIDERFEVFCSVRSVPRALGGTCDCGNLTEVC